MTNTEEIIIGNNYITFKTIHCEDEFKIIQHENETVYLFAVIDNIDNLGTSEWIRLDKESYNNMRNEFISHLETRLCFKIHEKYFLSILLTEDIEKNILDNKPDGYIYIDITKETMDKIKL